jgi:uncharacterized protein (TIGR02452 family)
MNFIQHKDLASVYKNTRDAIPCYHPEANNKLSTKYTLSYNNTPLDEATTYDNTYINVVNMDTFQVCERMVNKKKLNPLVLNFASAKRPGGGVEMGAMAQEEELFRRSSYSKCINKSLYPMKEDEFIATNNVTIFKDIHYGYLRKPFQCGCIAIAAITNPSLPYSKKNKQLMSDKIKTIFHYAVANSHDSLVLGAFGCGVYKNDPTIIAELFLQHQNEYKKYFRCIIYSVLSKNDNNYEIFKDIILKS